MRKIFAVDGNTQRLDGGAMFGNAPKAVWQKWIAPDEQNRIPLACRCMLVVENQGLANQRVLLFEAGIGAFFEPKMRERFGVQQSEHTLLQSLAVLGFTDADIDIVVLSHLHFDHAGGLLAAFHADAAPSLLFPKAKFVVSERAFARAQNPHARDKASFIPELPGLLIASGRLELVRGDHSALLGEDYRLHYSEGHTPGLMLTEVRVGDASIVYAGDLIPGAAWVHAPITMGYDRFAEQLIDEKVALLTDLAKRNGALFFTHDPLRSSALVIFENGRFSAGAAPAYVC